MLKLNPQALLVMELKIGRFGRLEEAVAQGLDINAKQYASAEFGLACKHSLLELAVLFGHVPIAQWLIRKGATENPTSSPALLLLAVGKQNLALCQLVEQLGFDPSVYIDTHPGLSALSMACGVGWLEGLMHWQKKGCSMTSLGPDGGSLWHVLMENCGSMGAQAREVAAFLGAHRVPWTCNHEGMWPTDVVPSYYQNVGQELERIHHEYVARHERRAIASSLKKEGSHRTSSRKKI